MPLRSPWKIQPVEEDVCEEKDIHNIQVHHGKLDYQESVQTISTAKSSNMSRMSSHEKIPLGQISHDKPLLEAEVDVEKIKRKKRHALRAAKQAILLRRSYQWRQGDDTKILASFCPSFLLKRLETKSTITPHTFFGKGACLIADISGFVKLCGRLSALGVNGIDDLRKCTNSYIGELVENVYKLGGDVVSFAGDAIICVFMACSESNGDMAESACCQRAIQCAGEIKNCTSDDLQCHVAVSYGEICFAILGGYEDKWTYLINGHCLTELSQSLDDAGSREAVVTASCFAKANLRKTDIQVEPVPGKDSVKISEVLTLVDPKDISDARVKNVLIISEMNKFVPSPVSASVGAGSFGILSELRQVTTLFLKLDSYCQEKHKDLLSLQPFFIGVQELLAASGGYMRQFLVDDKGCVIIGLWGVPGTNHPNNCSRALHCGVSISKFCKTLNHECSIGITTGNAYCGTVGSDQIRQDYVAMGDAVNLAARLMCKAEGRVLTDDVTSAELPWAMSAILKKGAPLQLKGRVEPLSPWAYSGAVLPPLFEADKDAENLIVSREVVELLSEETATLATYSDNTLWLMRTIDEEKTLRMEFNTDDIMIEGPLTGRSMREHSSRDISSREGSSRDVTTEYTPSHKKFAEFYPSVRVILLMGSAGSGKGNSVQLFRRLSKKYNFRQVSFRVNQFDGTIPYSTIRKLFLQLVGPTNFVTEEQQRDVISALFSDCYPDDDIGNAYRKHFPMLKLVLDLEWNYEKELGNQKVSRSYKFMGDETIQNILLSLFKKKSTTVVIEDINFCDELSWREFMSILNAKAPVLMLFTGSNALLKHDKRKIMSTSFRQNSSFGSSSFHDINNVSTIVPHSQNSLPQVSVKGGTRRESKFSVYGGLSELDGGTSRESLPDAKSQPKLVRAAVLLTKTKKNDFSKMKNHKNCAYMSMPMLGEWEVADILKSILDIDHVSESLSAEVLEISGGSIYWCHSIGKYIKTIGIEKFRKELTINYHEEDDSKDIFDTTAKSKNYSKILKRHIVFHLESLSVKMQTVAKYASVIGDEFYVSVLFEVLPERVCTSLHDLIQCVNSLSSHGILDLSDEEANIYSFQNDLIRKTLREYVLPSDAEIIHKNVAQTMEKLFRDQLRLIYASLSYHYAMSPDSERGQAFKYTVNAADQQIGNGNFSAGYLYLEYAASFAKYDTEIDILSQVTDTALYDMKQQKKNKSVTATVSDEDISHFEDMSSKFSNAVAYSMLNGAKILHSGSYEYIPNPGSIDSHPSFNNLPVSGKSTSSTPKKITSSKSFRNALTIKLPSYAARHEVNSRRKSLGSSSSCCSSCIVS